MPSYLKNDALRLVDGALECYTLALYGINIPTIPRRTCESRYAPAIGLLGASAELLIKACLFQAKGKSAVFRDNITFKYASEALEDFRKYLRDRNTNFDFLWRDVKDVDNHLIELIGLLSKFKILLTERASGLHNAHGPSKDIATISANDLYNFISLLKLSWRLKPYLTLCPKPEKPTLDRFALIRDLNQKLTGATSPQSKARHIRDLYLVMPYLSDDEPEWLAALERVQVTPKKDDISYLIKNLSNAHSVFLYKDDKDGLGIPARVDPGNPDAVPIEPHHLKRSFKKLSDIFQAQSAVSNGAFDEGKLSLPSPDIVLDLFQSGINEVSTGFGKQKLTAQVAWPFVASALNGAGTVYPSWFIIDNCFELQKLLSLLQKVKHIASGYYSNNFERIEETLADIANNREISASHRRLTQESDEYIKVATQKRLSFEMVSGKYSQPKDFICQLIQSYVSGEASLNITLTSIVGSEESDKYKKYWINRLVFGANRMDDITGLVQIMRCELMKNLRTNVRKALYHIDAYSSLLLNAYKAG